MSKKKCCLVLGMHRSGTSALTRVLNLMGAEVSENLLPGLPSDNTSGFWESRAVYDLHNQLFESLGIEWFDLSGEVLEQKNAVAMQTFRLGIQAVLQKEFSSADLVVLKDPRICILANYWIDIISASDAEPIAVIPVRNPLEVAESLEKRDDIDINYALFLWLRHFLDSERYTREISRSFCSFDALLNDWKKVIEKISDGTKICWPNAIADVAEDVDSFLSADAKHYNISDQQLFSDNAIPEIVKSTYSLALTLVESGDSADIRKKLDEIYTIVQTMDRLVVKRLVNLDSKCKETSEEKKQFNAKFSKQSSVVRDKNAEIAGLIITGSEKDAEIGAQATVLRAKDVEIEALNIISADKDTELTALAIRSEGLLGKISENEQLHDQLNAELADRSKNIMFLTNEVAAMKSSWSWALSSPLRWIAAFGKNRNNKKAVGVSQMVESEVLRSSIANVRHSGVFDEEFYTHQLLDTEHGYADHLAHYCAEGVRLGLDPNPYFSTNFYLQNNPDVAVASENPFSHYLTNGWNEGRDPSADFSTNDYLAVNPDVAEAAINPLLHYYLTGRFEGRSLRPVKAKMSLVNEVPEAFSGDSEALYFDDAVLEFDAEQAEKTKLVAFYLPQFHPIPENDEWWGKGFTEWTNVCAASPSFTGHVQPLFPSELGFYDLRMGEVREQQAKLAREYGIHGFCYYYYWFNGRRLLEKPLDDLLQSGKPDFPFCICWANEDWTRRWDGMDADVLMAQRHSVASDQDFIQDVIPILKDPRYIKLDGKPLLMIYRAELMDQPKKVTDMWRKACLDAGVGEIYLTSVIFREFDPIEFGFDAAVEFPPHFFPAPDGMHKVDNLIADFDGKILDYAAGVKHAIKHPVSKKFPVLRGVMPAWDNSARRGSAATIFHGATPALYAQWLRSAINHPCNKDSTQENIVFINAWNEWAEGAVLEPSQEFGRANLKATRWALTDESSLDDLLEVKPVSAESNIPSPIKNKQKKHLEQRLTDFVLRSPTLTSIAFKNRKIAGGILHAVRKVSGNTSQAVIPGVDEAHSLNRRRIVLVGHDAHPHGAQTLLLYIAKELHEELGFNIDLVLLGEGQLLDEYRQYATVHQLSSEETANQLAANLWADGITHAIANTTVSGLFAAVLKQQGMHVVSLVHELPGVIEQYKLQQHVSAIAEHVDQIIFPAKIVKSGFEKFCELPEGKSLVLPQGLFRPSTLTSKQARSKARIELRKKFGLPSDASIILGIGFADKRKGADLLVSIAEKMCIQETNTYFIWVGHYDPELHPSLIRHLKSADISDRVIFPGLDFNTDQYYAGADVFALTSREDPFPCVVLEALDARLPIVAFEDAGGFCDLLQDVGNTLVPQYDTEAFAEALINLIHAPDKMAELGATGYARVKSDFSFRRYCMELVTLSPDLLKKVSVVLPNYNYSRFLQQRIQGIIEQTYPVWEIIVLDDASTDDSVSILEPLLNDLNVCSQLLVNTSNAGNVFSQWQKGVAAASGKYLWIAEADDLADSRFLDEVMQSFSDDNVVLSYCESNQMANDESILANSYKDYVADISESKWQQGYIASGTEEIKVALAIKNTLPNVSAVVFKHAVLNAVLNNKLDEISTYKIAGDWLTYIYVLDAGDIAFSAQSLNYHRRHDESVTLSSFGMGQLKEIVSVQKHVREHYTVSESVAMAADAYAQGLYQQFGLMTDDCPELKHCLEMIE